MPNEVHNRRLVIVSNRLPFKVIRTGEGLAFEETTGGLVTGLRSYLDALRGGGAHIREYLWVGWPGSAVGEDEREALESKALHDCHSFPVLFSESEMENFYEGFCNKTLWPLFHYFPTFAVYKAEFWKNYKAVNEKFCEQLLGILRPDDIVWIHDYHLMVLPLLLKARTPNLPIGFFLHIPFPSYEIFRLLPVEWRKEILEGLLGADLIGFHTYEYTQHFLQCVLRILGYEHQLGRISLPSRTVTADAFPMGIDYREYSTALKKPEILREYQETRNAFGGVKVILSVDRLDYTKGILNRLQGFDILLETNPQVRGGVVLVMVVVPSRASVDQYDVMKRQIEELVGQINGKYSTVTWTPVMYQYKYLAFEALAALYNVSDIALVTPLRDGMNLVAKEFVASQRETKGVLILSEMAGAAKELGEAIIINPNNREEIAAAMKEALEMPEEEQIRRNRIMQNRLRRYDVHRWASDFIERLGTANELIPGLHVRLLTGADIHELTCGYLRSVRRLFLLDYDGTLVPLTRRPDQAKPGEKLLKLLHALSLDRKNLVVLISGRDRTTLQGWMGSVPVSLVAEHGIWMKEPSSEWTLLQEQSNAWKGNILSILEQYADRLPGAFVEEKEYSLSWHYRSADPEQSQWLARELTDHLVSYTANINLQVLQGKKVIEVRNIGADKGKAALHWIARHNPDFILAVGDDLTDEDLFAQLPGTSHTIRVGMTNTRARYNVRDSYEVSRLLEQFVKNPAEGDVS